MGRSPTARRRWQPGQMKSIEDDGGELARLRIVGSRCSDCTANRSSQEPDSTLADVWPASDTLRIRAQGQHNPRESLRAPLGFNLARSGFESSARRLRSGGKIGSL